LFLPWLALSLEPAFVEADRILSGRRVALKLLQRARRMA
jgi:hypothetical protein